MLIGPAHCKLALKFQVLYVQYYRMKNSLLVDLSEHMAMLCSISVLSQFCVFRVS